MRGHRLLKKNGNLDLIASIQSELTERDLGIGTKDLVPSIFGGAINFGELVVRQYLLLSLGGRRLSCALLSSLAHPEAKLVYPMPIQWRMVVEKHGLGLSHWRCELLWRFYSLALWGYGVVQALRLLSHASLRSNTPLPCERYVYFIGLNSGNLPQREGGGASHDIVSWYLQWEGRERQITSVRHGVAGIDAIELDGVTVCSQPSVLPRLAGMHYVIRYLLWGCVAALSSILSLLRGQCWSALLMNQAGLRALVALAPAELVAAEYLFHNSEWLYRPLWTYELESKGSGASLYFYSTNCERFKGAQGYPAPHYGYAAMNWPRYLVWDSYQAEFVRRVAGSSSPVVEVGPVWFSSNSQVLEERGGRTLALFDVTPFRCSKFCELGMDNLFYTPEVANAFVRDVIDLSLQIGVEVLWKRKRNLGRSAHPKYRQFVDLLEYGKDVRIVAPEISAVRVIQVSCAVVSMPFTSTALIAKSIGIPSVYYDPYGIVQRDDRAAHGIQILIGRLELECWLKETLLRSCSRSIICHETPSPACPLSGEVA